ARALGDYRAGVGIAVADGIRGSAALARAGRRGGGWHGGVAAFGQRHLARRPAGGAGRAGALRVVRTGAGGPGGCGPRDARPASARRRRAILRVPPTRSTAVCAQPHVARRLPAAAGRTPVDLVSPRQRGQGTTPVVRR